jgi:hypothetical protein
MRPQRFQKTSEVCLLLHGGDESPLPGPSANTSFIFSTGNSAALKNASKVVSYKL